MPATRILNDDLVSITFDGGNCWAANRFVYLDAFLGVPFAIEYRRERIVDEQPIGEIKIPVLQEIPGKIKFVPGHHPAVKRL